MCVTDLAVKILKSEEGWSDTPYYCSEGYPTVGYGVKIGDKGAPLPMFLLPGSVGELWLRELVQGAVRFVENSYRNNLSEVRKAVLVSIVYQIGAHGLQKFVKTNEHINASRFTEASEEMLDSLWAKKQTPGRAKRHSLMMKENKLLPRYEAV